ncbi:hypothetical protein E1B28_002037 [Marasmius oreades]|uniref:Uncharacterized protein n=1 Tax=Marasmius oreades TaxID=181124 RepID=A0A9P7V4U6_9AGAR|nr:uncharacterized protein E1B28_002037 [Marasmius oreades]KAG7100264.1 hypothetical protein E1B28_002037 [Marasmius oreades]
MKKARKYDLELLKGVQDRLRPGQIVLVADGLFRYPARLLHPRSKSQWTVKWYPHNQVGEGAKHTPGAYDVVSTAHIVDALYGDVVGRRGIQLRRFITMSELQETDAERQLIIEDPTKSLPYTPEIHTVLSPHRNRFINLIFKCSQVEVDTFPTIQYMRCSRVTVVPYTGGFPIETSVSFHQLATV